MNGRSLLRWKGRKHKKQEAALGRLGAKVVAAGMAYRARARLMFPMGRRTGRFSLPVQIDFLVTTFTKGSCLTAARSIESADFALRIAFAE